MLGGVVAAEAVHHLEVLGVDFSAEWKEHLVHHSLRLVAVETCRSPPLAVLLAPVPSLS